jgi:hypothetical protein
LGHLEVLSAARIRDLLAPGQVLLKLAVAGFGVYTTRTPDTKTSRVADRTFTP